MILPWLRGRGIGQSVRSQGPSSHLKKAGTLTMGGVGFTAVFLLVPLFLGIRSQEYMLVFLVTTVYAILGFVDDYLKVTRNNSLGLPARYKIFVEIALAIAAVYIASNVLGRGTVVTLFPTSLSFDLQSVYILFGMIVIIGTANAVNLTDGLDGLAGGTATIAFLVYGILYMSIGRIDLAVTALGIAGSLAGFLPYNIHPAKVFMGDTGSLALGGALGSMAVVSGTEMRLVIIGGVFVIETLSVIIQVVYFRLTGDRVFLMSPLHHHFELAGWSESKVVRVFWLLGVLFGILGLWGLGGV
jgi:phospho-N-acetylmuramoyl-pentapeptide-transferase